MDLQNLRQEIDRIDAEIVARLNQRTRLASEIGRIKSESGAPIYVPKREEEVFQRVCGLNQGPLPDTALRAIYREVMSAAISLERRMTVAYLGPQASYCHQAALRKFGQSLDYCASPNISEIFTAVEKGEADYGVIPVENSTEGGVTQSLDLLVETDLKIAAQVFLEIQHNLISRASAPEIRRVYSKDTAIAQCRRWLQVNLPQAELVDTASTTRAVQIAAQEDGAAAIASALAADLYGVPVVAANIQDKADNTTRFFVLGKHSSEPLGGGRDRSSFVLSIKDEPGSLHSALDPFCRRGINLCKIESRPSKRRVWDYVFFIDIVGHHDDPPVQDAIRELRPHCSVVKWLGSYPNTAG